MYEGPLTLKCPVGGEEWPVDSFKCFVDGMKEKQTPSTITFLCPANHCFKLKQAMAGGMLTKAQGKRLLASAEEHAADYRRCENGQEKKEES